MLHKSNLIIFSLIIFLLGAKGYGQEVKPGTVLSGGVLSGSVSPTLDSKNNLLCGGLFPPAIGPDGAVYYPLGNSLLAKDENGRRKWEFKTSGRTSSSPALGFDGTVYVGSWGEGIYASDGQDGSLHPLHFPFFY